MGGADEDRRGRAARRCAAQKEPRRRQGWAATGGRRERPRRTTATGGATADGRERTDGDVLLLLKKVRPRIRDGRTAEARRRLLLLLQLLRLDLYKREWVWGLEKPPPGGKNPSSRGRRSGDEGGGADLDQELCYHVTNGRGKEK